jgi:uncharacterized damage-inducible protein DinB
VEAAPQVDVAGRPGDPHFQPAYLGHDHPERVVVRPNAEEKTARAAILGAFGENTQKTRDRMDRTDAEYLERWTLKRADQELFSMPRVAAFRTFLMYHLVHHRGQLSVYLRLNDIPVPAIYGPTADEA